MKYIIDFEKGTLKTPENDLIKFDGIVQGIALLLPTSNLQKNFFTQLESTYFQNGLQDKAYMSIANYCRINKISRQCVYDRIRYNKVDTVRKGRYVFIKDSIK